MNDSLNRHSWSWPRINQWLLWLGLAGAVIYMVVRHNEHLVQLLPFLLILACPLMHLFGHGHGGHGGHEHAHSGEGGRANANSAPLRDQRNRPDWQERRGEPHFLKAAAMDRRFPWRLSTWLFLACGVWLVALGGYFALFRPPLLPEDPRYIGSTLADIQEQVPGLARWLARVFTVMGGYIAAVGVLTCFVAVTVMPRRVRGTGPCLAIAGALSVALMSATNFDLGSDFKWLLLIPVGLWLIATVSYANGR